MIHAQFKDTSVNFSIIAVKMNGMPQISSLVSDPRNIELLKALQEDPRQPVSKLASRIGMSAPAVKERLT
ncbi:MAG TPA: AsnC family protein, partial [Rhodanobacter sp.]|nr:AsnC family protein [Rhodanobacter sp.]